jgi:hypothetical protein
VARQRQAILAQTAATPRRPAGFTLALAHPRFDPAFSHFIPCGWNRLYFAASLSK